MIQKTSKYLINKIKHDSVLKKKSLIISIYTMNGAYFQYQSNSNNEGCFLTKIQFILSIKYQTSFETNVMIEV